MNHNEDPLDHEVDFSRSVRGKFYRPDGEMHLPVYLEPELLRALTEIASRKDMSVDALVNTIIRNDLAIAEVLR
jgi:hypothetical protein